MFHALDHANPARDGDRSQSSGLDDLRAGLEETLAERLNQVRETLLGSAAPADLWRPVADWRID